MRIFLLFIFAVNAYAQEYRVCEFAAPIENLKTEPLKHKRNRIVTSFEPRHTANDVITTFGQAASLEGKFSYGLLGKDLVDEDVEIWLDICKANLSLAHRARTNSNGVVRWTFPSEVMKTPGEYRVWMRVVGDGTAVSATLRVLPPGAKVAVFDIDGTLTASEIDVNLEVISELIGGTYSPLRRDYSAELSHFLHDRLGYEIVYLTGRHYFLEELTRTWLARNDFARGSLMMTRSFFEIYPTNSSVGKFKIEMLEQIKSSGIQLKRAYGNAPTDVFAYEAVGLSRDRIFVLGQNSETLGGVSLGSSFHAHYQDLLNGGNGEPH